jgi:hypothetical protein
MVTPVSFAVMRCAAEFLLPEDTAEKSSIEGASLKKRDDR